MPTYWGSRMRRGLWTKNYHWQAANWARLANFLLGNGFRTAAELRENADRMRQKEMRPQGNTRISKNTRLDVGMKVTVVCLECGKKFKRQFSPTPTLNPHKTPYGLPCTCKTGYTEL